MKYKIKEICDMKKIKPSIIYWNVNKYNIPLEKINGKNHIDEKYLHLLAPSYKKKNKYDIIDNMVNQNKTLNEILQATGYTLSTFKGVCVKLDYSIRGQQVTKKPTKKREKRICTKCKKEFETEICIPSKPNRKPYPVNTRCRNCKLKEKDFRLLT